MKVLIELEIDIIVTESVNHEHNQTNKYLLFVVNSLTGMYVEKMYIDDLNIKSAKIL
jgi:hypothetical protein